MCGALGWFFFFKVGVFKDLLPGKIPILKPANSRQIMAERSGEYLKFGMSASFLAIGWEAGHSNRL